MHIKVIIEHSDYLFIIPASVLGIIIYRKSMSKRFTNQLKHRIVLYLLTKHKLVKERKEKNKNRWGAERESSKRAKGQSSVQHIAIRFTASINSIVICCPSHTADHVYRIRTAPVLF